MPRVVGVPVEERGMSGLWKPFDRILNRYLVNFVTPTAAHGVFCVLILVGCLSAACAFCATDY